MPWLHLPAWHIYIYNVDIKDGVKKSKWKFKMAFAMKGGGLEWVSSAIYLFWIFF